MKLFGSLLLLVGIVPADTRVKLEDLPAAVRNAVHELTKTATLVGLSIEVEKGRTTYEVETKVDGKSRDVVLDKTGAVLEVEEEVDIDSIPAAAKAALLRKAANGAIRKVEKVTAGSNISYEAAIKTKAGKTIEAGVNADGSPHKE